MEKNRVVYCCISMFIVGTFIGVVLGYYVLTKISSIRNNLENQSIYTIQNKCEVEEVKIKKFCVDINGSVKHPGIYCLDEGSLLKNVLDKAGGFKTTYAKEYIDRKVNLALPIKNNQKIYLPYSKDTNCELQEFNIVAKDIEDNLDDTNNSSTQEDSDSNDNNESDTQCVNINSATLNGLDSLDGIGPSTAQKIIDRRPYTKKEDLLNVSGIGQATYDKFKDVICL